MSAGGRRPSVIGPAGAGFVVDSIPVERVDIGFPLRPVDEVWARDLGHQMLAEGQREPIEVTPAKDGYRLVTGLHRLEAAGRYRGLSPIKVSILDPAAAGRRIAMLAARFGADGAPPLAVPALVADIHALLGVSDAGETPAQPDDRTDRIARLLGTGAGRVVQLLEVHRRLRARVIAMLDSAPLGHDQLMALAALAPAEQEKVAYLLLGGAPDVAAARDELRRRKRAAFPDMRGDAFVALFEQMSVGEKEAALRRISAFAPPSFVIRRIAV